jgi:hypothetical protein
MQVFASLPNILAPPLDAPLTVSSVSELCLETCVNVFGRDALFTKKPNYDSMVVLHLLNENRKLANRWPPLVFKIGAFFHSEESMTTIMQIFDRVHVHPLDSLRWRTTPVRADQVQGDGICVEGFRWRERNGMKKRNSSN